MTVHVCVCCGDEIRPPTLWVVSVKAQRPRPGVATSGTPLVDVCGGCAPDTREIVVQAARAAMPVGFSLIRARACTHERSLRRMGGLWGVVVDEYQPEGGESGEAA
jgi:hypothetical protein